MTCRTRLAIGVGLLWAITGALPLLAQNADNVAPTNPPVSIAEPGGVDIQADRLEYEADEKLMRGIGHVIILHEDDHLQADYVEVYTDTQDTYARGNVVFTRSGKVWQGDELRYNFKTKVGDFGEFMGFSDPFYINAEDSEKVTANEFLLKDATISTCEGPNPQFAIRAKRATLTDGSKLRAHNVLIYLAGIPIFYLPYLQKDLNKDSNLDVVPGYSDRMGAFLLTAYNYRLNQNVTAATHLDYRSERGVGVGQDFLWQATNKAWIGDLRTYYIDDDMPFEDEEEEEERGDVLDNERYRFRLGHLHNFTPNDYVIAELNYQSDPHIIEDFFDEEFRGNAQPENRITYLHREDRFTAGAEVTFEPHDFYDALQRLPELTLDFPRQRVGDTGFFYDGENSLSLLERVFAEGDDDEDYDAIRFDSSHTLFYPTRHFGFLNIIPRAGYRLTYYSDTREQMSVSNLITTTNSVSDGMGGSNDVVTTTNETSIVDRLAGSDVRNVFTLGVESSFKAFKVLHNEPGIMGKGLRHVAEPFTEYIYRPEPNLLEDDLLQFDRVDDIDERHTLTLGMRNKLQTKRKGVVHDLVDLEISTDYILNADSDDNDFTSLFFDGELRLTDWLQIDFDGEYDWYGDGGNEFRTQVAFIGSDKSSLGFEYRFKEDDQSLLQAQIILWPQGTWSWTSYWRYEGETSELEEQSYLLIHRTDCLGLGVGFKEIDEDITVWAQIWLLAFPESQIDLGR